MQSVRLSTAAIARCRCSPAAWHFLSDSFGYHVIECQQMSPANTDTLVSAMYKSSHYTSRTTRKPALVGIARTELGSVYPPLFWFSLKIKNAVWLSIFIFKFKLLFSHAAASLRAPLDSDHDFDLWSWHSNRPIEGQGKPASQISNV